MPKVKGGLGRGMDALFGEMAEETENRIQMIPIGQIDPNKEQPRKQFDLESLDQLASSIQLGRHHPAHRRLPQRQALHHRRGRTPLACGAHGRVGGNSCHCPRR